MSNDLGCTIGHGEGENFVHVTHSASTGTTIGPIGEFPSMWEAIYWHNLNCTVEYGLSFNLDEERMYAMSAPAREELNIRKFIRKPLIVEGIQVNAHNMKEVAAWCGGTYTQTASKRPYIRVQIRTAPTDRMSMAFAGDWILKSDIGFKIYSKRSFDRTFESMEEWPDGQNG